MIARSKIKSMSGLGMWSSERTRIRLEDVVQTGGKARLDAGRSRIRTRRTAGAKSPAHRFHIGPLRKFPFGSLARRPRRLASRRRVGCCHVPRRTRRRNGIDHTEREKRLIASPTADPAVWRAGRSTWHSTGYDGAPWRGLICRLAEKVTCVGISDLGNKWVRNLSIIGFFVLHRTSLDVSAANAATKTPPSRWRPEDPTDQLLPANADSQSVLHATGLRNIHAVCSRLRAASRWPLLAFHLPVVPSKPTRLAMEKGSILLWQASTAAMKGIRWHWQMN